MKRTYVIISIVMAVLLLMTGCNQTNKENQDDTNQAVNDTENTQHNEGNNEPETNADNDEAYGLNDTVEVEGITFKITGVSLTDERVEESVQNPNEVVRIDYEIKNARKIRSFYSEDILSSMIARKKRLICIRMVIRWVY